MPLKCDHVLILTELFCQHPPLGVVPTNAFFFPEASVLLNSLQWASILRRVLHIWRFFVVALKNVQPRVKRWARQLCSRSGEGVLQISQKPTVT